MTSYNPFTLRGKTILVTGASSGIGRGIAVSCSKMKATVIINGRNASKLEDTLSLLEGEGHQIVIADLTNKDAVKKLVEKIPKLDGVVHCAGIVHRLLARQVSDNDISLIMNTNFIAPVLLQSEIMQRKKLNNDSSVIFMASLGADSPNIGNSLYSASKGAIISYAKCLMAELAPRKIRVNCISPAMVWTDLAHDNIVTDEQLKEDEKRYPLKRYGTPDDIANLAIYLLSDASSWMTGNNIKITGGITSLY